MRRAHGALGRGIPRLLAGDSEAFGGGGVGRLSSPTMVMSSTLKLGSAFCIWSSSAVARSHRMPPVQYMSTFLPLRAALVDWRGKGVKGWGVKGDLVDWQGGGGGCEGMGG